MLGCRVITDQHVTALRTVSTVRDDIGKLILRLTLGGLLLLHGFHKILNGIEPIRVMLANYHMPEFLSYGVYIGEVVAPVLIVLGIFARIGALLVVVNMIAAIVLARMPDLFKVYAQSGGYALEAETFFLFCAVSVALLGAGRYSLADSSERWN
jgi:putative oxidoreductase